MCQSLKSLIASQAGLPFRGSVPFVEEGRAYALQMRDLGPNGEVAWEGLIRTEVDTGKAVKSPTLLPELLAWQINCAPVQRYLATNAEGSDQLSIRRPVLEALSLPEGVGL